MAESGRDAGDSSLLMDAGMGCGGGVRACAGKGSAMRVLIAGLMGLLAAPVVLGQGMDVKKVNEYLKTLPAVTAPVYDEAKRETLAASAISCTDHPEEAPANRNNYLWQYAKAAQLLDNYDKGRA